MFLAGKLLAEGVIYQGNHHRARFKMLLIGRGTEIKTTDVIYRSIPIASGYSAVACMLSLRTWAAKSCGRMVTRPFMNSGML